LILITGGGGYIGSHTNKLLSKTYSSLVYDNLVYGHREFVKWGELIEGDLADTEKLESVFQANQIDAVIHLAAYAYVGESVANPSKYYNNNVVNTVRLLDVMNKYGCDKLVFSSSCTVYGIPETNPIVEGTPKHPISPYGESAPMPVEFGRRSDEGTAARLGC
jgi:UDP-glucose 4-epimerase